MADIQNTGLLSRLFRSGHAYQEIKEILSQARPKGRCLDLPAGKGVNLKGIRQAGFEPVACDLFPECIEKDSAFRAGADFSQNLPFADNSFEAVLCSEGVEHCPVQLDLIREFSRVLLPGGTLLITTPNILNYRARAAFMLTGQSSLARDPVSEVTHVRRESTGSRLYMGHVFLLSYFQLRFLLKISGFSDIRVYTAKYSMSSVILAPFLWLPVKLFTRRVFAAKAGKKDPRAFAEILRHALSRDILLGKKLIISARKD
ncbi:MAG: class I SAM-dependent methyltransferase [Desulfonatronovibrionaceae bacterium]